MKKRCIFLMLSITFYLAANAQEYKKFKFGLGIGPTLTPDGEYVGLYGILLSIEPIYCISDHWSIGIRIEHGATQLSDLDANDIMSYTINGQYYFTNDKPRWFLGGGLGLYTLDPDDTISVFGFYPRLGFDAAHFSMSMDYNFISFPKENQPYYMYNNYLGLRFAMFIGGGKIRSQSTVQ